MFSYTVRISSKKEEFDKTFNGILAPSQSRADEWAVKQAAAFGINHTKDLKFSVQLINQTPGPACTPAPESKSGGTTSKKKSKSKVQAGYIN
jgi:hypothetical protein